MNTAPNEPFEDSVNNICSLLGILELPSAVSKRFNKSLKIYNSASIQTHTALLRHYAIRSWVIKCEAFILRGEVSKLGYDKDFIRHVELFSLFALSILILDKKSTDFEYAFTKKIVQRIPLTIYKIGIFTEEPCAVKLSVENGRVLSTDALVEISKKLSRETEFEIGVDLSFCRSDVLGQEFSIDAIEMSSNKWTNLLSKAWEIVKKDNNSTAFVEKYCSGLCGIKTTDLSVHSSFSSRECPGVIFFSYTNDPMILAEALVHESDHQMLYLMDREFGLFNEKIESDKLYRSPWRTDPRPIEGVLFGASAFVKVSEFWSEAISKLDGSMQDRAGKLAVLANLQSTIALEIICGVSGLTDFARNFTSELSRRNKASMEILDARSDYPAWAAYAEDKVDEHRKVWAKLNT